MSAREYFDSLDVSDVFSDINECIAVTHDGFNIGNKLSREIVHKPGIIFWFPELGEGCTIPDSLGSSKKREVIKAVTALGGNVKETCFAYDDGDGYSYVSLTSTNVYMCHWSPLDVQVHGWKRFKKSNNIYYAKCNNDSFHYWKSIGYESE